MSRLSPSSIIFLAAAAFFAMLLITDRDNPGTVARQAATAEITDSVLIRRQTQDAQERLAQQKLKECTENPRCANYDVESRTWTWKEEPSGLTISSGR